MSQAAQIILSAPNPFTTNPSFTYFETKYKNDEQPLRVSFEIPLDNQNLAFGSTYECTIPAYGDILTSVFLRATLPPIYPTQAQTYVYPYTSTSFAGSLYVQKNITYITSDGSVMTVTTDGSHFFSLRSPVDILTGSVLDGNYIITSIPSAESFTCSSSSIGSATSGVASVIGIQPAPVVGYYSTQNLNLWEDNLVNLTYTENAGQITVPNASLVPGQTILFTQSSQPELVGNIYTVATSTGNTFTISGSSLTLASQFIENSITVSYNPLQNKFIFFSMVYTSISFSNAQDAAFWGFDYLQGPVFPFVNGYITTPWNLNQGGWIQGFLPPSLSKYDDSVAHKLIKEARILLGRQVIKRYTGEYLELINDLTIPYENKAILKLMNGTLDFTQAVSSREYYVSLPLGCEHIPICALSRQQMSIEIDFENYNNLSNDLNVGSGDFYDPNSYIVYDASANLLNGAPFNVFSTLSYQEYILVLTTGGNIIIYNTSLPIDSPSSYFSITGLSGQLSLFINFAFLGNFLYIQLLNGYVVRGFIDELIQGNITSFISNNYIPTDPVDIGPPTGSIVCDAKYVYYSQSNLAETNVFFIQYDTSTGFQPIIGYTSFDFTANVNSSVSAVYQTLSTGTQLISITNTPGVFYQFNLNGNFTTDWVPIDYSAYGTQITEGVLIGTVVYFVIDSFNILLYQNSSFKLFSPSLPWSLLGNGFQNLHAVGATIYASSYSAGVTTSIIQFNITSNIYQYYSTSTGNSPIAFTEYVPIIFANGPRFLYIFTSDLTNMTSPTNVTRYDSYPVTPVLQASIIADYKFLPADQPKPTDATIKYVQNQHVTWQNFADLQLLGPIKELIVTGTANTTNVYEYSNLTSNLSLTITGHEDILTPDVGTITGLHTIAPFQYHTAMPVRNLSVIPFEINPESTEPNGTINFSRLQYQMLSNGSSIWATSYNILKISSGIGGLEFNSPY